MTGGQQIGMDEDRGSQEPLPPTVLNYDYCCSCYSFIFRVSFCEANMSVCSNTLHIGSNCGLCIISMLLFSNKFSTKETFGIFCISK